MFTLPRYGYEPIVILLFSFCISRSLCFNFIYIFLTIFMAFSVLPYTLLRCYFLKIYETAQTKNDHLHYLNKKIEAVQQLIFIQKQQYKEDTWKKFPIDHIMKNIKDELISQQIDIVIIGSRSFELLEILLDKDLQLVPMPKLKTKYLAALSSLYTSDPSLDFHHSSKFPASLPESKIQKYTTNLLTDSFWLQFNFYYLGALSHDPLLASITRGRISLCIIASTQSEAENGMLKKLLTRDPLQPPFRQYQSADSMSLSQSSKQSNSRQQLIIQQKIINLMHSYKLNEFSSVLSVKMLDKNRIIESTSNIKLNRYQILRWICERYFQNQFGIKLRGQLGDEIQNYTEEVRENYCSVM